MKSICIKENLAVLEETSLKEYP
ncbi:MAG: hypothetical protein ACD_19C00219G0001, partial [uncultured bacterium]